MSTPTTDEGAKGSPGRVLKLKESLRGAVTSPYGVYGLPLEPEGLSSTPTTSEGAKGSPGRVHGTLGPEGLSAPPTTSEGAKGSPRRGLVEEALGSC